MSGPSGWSYQWTGDDSADDALVPRTMTVAELAAWIEPYWARVSLEDAILDARLGTDDAPHLSLIERTYTPEYERVYGEWGSHRSVAWELGRRGTPIDVAAIARRAAQYVAAFVARNGRVRLVLSGTVLNRCGVTIRTIERVQS